MTRSYLGIAWAIVFAIALSGTFSAQTRTGGGAPTPESQPARSIKQVDGELLVKFRRGTPAAERAIAHAWSGARRLRSFDVVPDLEQVRLRDGLSVKDALALYRSHPDVLYAEPNYVVQAVQDGSSVPNDSRFGDLWGLHNIGQSSGVADADIDAPEAWNLTTGSRSVVVAVIDSGIDYNHPDLVANLFRNTADCNSNGVDDDGNGYIDDCYGIDTANGDSDPFDDNSHGTHTAGTIGATGNNGVGVVGVNWNVQIMACKFLGANGAGSTAGAIACLDYVRRMKDRGVNIVATSNSWSGGAFSQALYDAIDAQRQRGILFVAAAANAKSDNDVTTVYPANYDLPNVISVAATTRTDTLATFSDYGRHTVHLGAPGQDVLSTTPGNSYSVFSGTSMATPHVSGVAALLKAHNPSRDWRAIKNLILAGGDSIPVLGNTITGKRLNAFGALTCTDSTVVSRLQPSSQLVLATVNVPVRLAELHIKCANPNGPVTVAVSPGGSTITLLDDGTTGDQAAGDGVYTGQFTPTAPQTYTLTFPGGDIVTVAVPASYNVTPTTYRYRTITGTSLNLIDDSADAITPPFPLRLGGIPLPTLYAGSNGVLSFTGPPSDYFNVPLPNTLAQTLVAPFWDDFFPSGSQNVYWDVVGAAPNRELVVEWRNVPTFNCQAGGTVTFQVVFFEATSDIVFNYADTVAGGACTGSDHGAGATIGLQVAPTRATQFGYNTPVLADGMALLWTLQPVSSDPVLSLVPNAMDFGAVSTGEFSDRTFAIQNIGGGTLTGTVTTTGPFTVVSGGSFALGPLASQPLVIRFRPNAGGLLAGTVNVTSNGSNATASLSGTGIPQALSIKSASNFGTVPIGPLDGLPLIAGGGNGSYIWSVSTGALPPGISIRTDLSSSFPANASAGLIGVATAPGTYTFTLRATSGSEAVEQVCTVKITGLTIADGNHVGYLPDAFVGAAYNYTMRALNIVGPPTWSASNLPPGMSLSPSGALSGTPTSSGIYSATFTLTDSLDKVSRSIVIPVNVLNITTPGVLPNGTPGGAYSVTLTVSGGVPPYTFSGSVPSGLTLSASGTISGTLASFLGAGPASASVSVRDINNASYSKSFSIDVVAPPALASLNLIRYGPGNFNDCTIGVVCSRGIAVVSGGTAPFTWSAAGLPPGLFLRPGTGASNTWVSSGPGWAFRLTAGDGEIWGVPVQTGTFQVTLTATDATGATTTETIPFVVSGLAQLNSLSLPSLNTPYSQAVRLIGGTLPYTATLLTGAMPAGLTLDTHSLLVSGTPLENAFFSPVFAFTDSSGQSVRLTENFSISGTNPAVTITSSTNLGSIAIGSDFSRQLTACCVSSFLWSVAGGALPPNFNLSSGGLLSGTATTAGIYTFLIKAADASNSASFGARQFTLEIVSGTPLTITTLPTLPLGSLGSAYSMTFASIGGSGAVSWTLAPFNYLPPGLTLAPGGLLAGTPQGTGAFSFTINATDTGGHLAQRTFTLSVYPAGRLGRISGRVTDAVTGAPLPGATVTTFTSAGAQIGTTTSDPSGQYLTGELLPGNYFARASAGAAYVDELYREIACVSGCTITTGTPISVGASIVRTGIDFTLSPLASIAGKVTGPDGVIGIPGVRVEVSNTAGTLVKTAPTDALGQYAAAGLAASVYVARTTNASGYADRLYNNMACALGCNVTSGTRITATLATVATANFLLPFNTQPGSGVLVQPRDPDNWTTPLTVQFAQATVAGRTTLSVSADAPPGGLPLPGGFSLGAPSRFFNVTTTAIVSGPMTVCINYTGTAFTDANTRLLHFEGGIWIDRTSSLDPLARVVCATTSSLSPFVLASSPGAPPMPPIVSSPVAGSTIVGPLVAIVGAGLPGASITIFAGGSPVGLTTADAAGNFSLQVVLAFVVQALSATQTTPGGTSGPSPLIAFTVIPPAPTITAPASLSTSVSTAVTVAGTGVPGLTVTIRDGVTPIGTGTVNGAGVFLIPVSLALGTHTLTAVQAPGVIFASAPSAPVIVTIVAPASSGQFEGTVTDAVTGAPLANVTVSANNLSGTTVALMKTDATGHYVTPPLASAGYFARATTGSAAYLDEIYQELTCITGCIITTGTRITVTAGLTRGGIDFTLSPLASIVGTVTNPAGAAMPDVTVTVFDVNAVPVKSAATNLAGRYAITGLGPGNYLALARNPTGFADVLYDAVACTAGCTLTSGTKISGVLGLATTANFQLPDASEPRVLPAIRWAPPAAITYGTPLGPGQLNATSFVPGTFTYTPAGGTILNSGNNQLLSVTFTPADTVAYRPVTATVVINVLKVTPTVTWAAPAPIPAGTALGAAQLNATANVPGTFVYSPPAGTILPFGNGQVLTVVFTPADTANGNVVMRSVSINVVAGPVSTPLITWLKPLPIFAGTPLGAAQLRATANTPGTFLYTPPAGTILPVGSGQLLTVRFNPADTARFTSVTASVLIDVLAAPTGQFSGRVTDAVTGAAVPNATITVYDASGTAVGTTQSDAGGQYLTSALPSALYEAKASAGTGYVDELYRELSCLLGCNPVSGTRISVAANLTTANVNFTLSPLAAIVGTVVGTDNTPLAGITVLVSNLTGAVVKTVSTNAAGQYAATGLPSGSYFAATSNSRGYADRLYNGIACVTGCDVTLGVAISTSIGLVATAGFQLPDNTQPGLGVIVQPREPASGTFPVAVTYTTVGSAGRTTLAVTSSGAALPPGYQAGLPPLYFNVATTAAVAPPIKVCVSAAGSAFLDPGRIRLLLAAGSSWGDITTSLDQVARVVCGFAPYLSNFAVAEFVGSPPTVSVVSPNGGETLFQSSTARIQWSASGDLPAASVFDVGVSPDGGVTYASIADCTGLGSAVRSCLWAAPMPMSETARIRVTVRDGAGHAVSDASDADFTITGVTPAIRVTSPNTAVSWPVGTSHAITWTHDLGAQSFVRIDVSRDGGGTWTPITGSARNDTASAGSFQWTVTGPQAPTALIRVRGADVAVSDTSDVPFAIVGPALTVTSPNGAGTLRIGNTHTITFTHNFGAGQPVNLEVSRFGPFGPWTAITAAPVTTTSATSGSYAWVVGGPATTHGRVRVSWANDPAVFDISDVDFTIAGPTITVTSPNGAGTIFIGSPRPVTFTHNLGVGQVMNVEISRTGAAGPWSSIGTVATTNATSGSYQWTVSGPATTRARIRVSWDADPAVADVSDVDFTIAAPASP